MNTNTVENRIWAVANFLRGTMTVTEALEATYLAIRVREETKNISKKLSNMDLFGILVSVAETEMVHNPYSGPTQLNDVLGILGAEEEFDLEQCLAIYNGSYKASRCGCLVKPLLEEYTKFITDDVESVLLAEAEVFVPHTKRIVDEHPNVEFTLVTDDYMVLIILKHIFEGYKNVAVQEAEIYQEDFINQKFDLILALPKFGGRSMKSSDEFICREYEMVALENLALYMKRDGRLVIIMPARITFAGGNVGDLRRFMQQMYKLEEISSLPEGILPYTAIKAYMLVFSTGTTEDVIIRDLEVFGIRKKGDPIDNLGVANETFAMADELEAMGDWNINRLFAEIEQALAYDVSDVKMEELGNVAQIFRGKAITRKSETGKIAVVNISNIGQYELDYDGMDHIDEDKRRVFAYLLQEGDVLLPARGTAIRAVVFHEKSYPVIASSNVIVIRPQEDKLNGVYLKNYFDSYVGHTMIESLQQGTTVMNISYKDLNDLQIPLPEIEKQNEIAAEYTTAYEKYKMTIQTAEEEWKKTVKRLQNYK